VRHEELQQFLDEINGVYGRVYLTVDDISMVNTGLILFGTKKSQGGDVNHSFGKRSMLIDHLREDNIEGLLTLIGVRATVARRDAERVIGIIQKRLSKREYISRTGITPIWGGRIDNFEQYLAEAERRSNRSLGSRVVGSLVRNYGSEYRQVIDHALKDPSFGEEIDGTGVLQAEVVHAVREEMAEKLGDVVFRRTELGSGGYPGRQAIEITADIMARELQWGQQRTKDEMDEVLDIFSRRGPWRVS
jgi:glycerol-3-phosphate dehydrogenase